MNDDTKKFAQAPADDVREFARLVREIRGLQKRFFRGDKSVFASAKMLEKHVDRAVDAILGDTEGQPTLF